MYFFGKTITTLNYFFDETERKVYTESPIIFVGTKYVRIQSRQRCDKFTTFGAIPEECLWSYINKTTITDIVVLG